MSPFLRKLAKDPALMARWRDICLHKLPQGIERLTQEERVWYGVRSIMDATYNGGVISYFFNSGADHLENSIAALGTVGADDAKFELERVAALFPKESLGSFEARNAAIQNWGENEAANKKTLDILQDASQKMMQSCDRVEEKLFNFLKRSGIAN